MGREYLAVRALVEVALAWWDGTRPPEAGEVADRLDAPAETVRQVLSTLEDGGLVTEGEGGRLTPARPLDRISLADVRRIIAGPLPPRNGAGMQAIVAGVLGEGESAAEERLSKTSIHDLCQAVRTTPPPPFEAVEMAPEGE
jgi:membrane protein